MRVVGAGELAASRFWQMGRFGKRPVFSGSLLKLRGGSRRGGLGRLRGRRGNLPVHPRATGELRLRAGRSASRMRCFVHRAFRAVVASARCGNRVQMTSSSGEVVVSIDSTLKRKGRLVRARNVLTREERIKRLTDEDRYGDSSSPLGLPKVRIIKTVVGKKKKKEKKEDEKDDKKKKKK